MQPLQTLDQEFDIANPARAELDVQTRFGGRGRLLPSLGRELPADPVATFGDRLHRAEIGGGRVDHWLDEIEQLAAEVAVARRDARLDKHLQLPVAAAPAVVIARAVERDADFSMASIGTQP